MKKKCMLTALLVGALCLALVGCRSWTDDEGRHFMLFGERGPSGLTVQSTAFEQKNDSQAPSKYSFGQGAKSQQSLVDCKISQRRPTLYFPVMGCHSFVKTL